MTPPLQKTYVRTIYSLSMTKTDWGRILVKSLWASYFLVWVILSGERLAETAPPWKIVQVLLMIQCGLIAVFFILRNPAKITSWKIYDVVISTFGTFGPYLFIPVNEGNPKQIGIALEVLGSVLTTLAFLSLERSIGFLPANRGVRSKGMYGLVRHPVYLSYQIFHVGYLINQFNFYNLSVAVVCLLAEVLRIFSEEEILRKDPDYVEYTKKVKWRLIPFVF